MSILINLLPDLRQAKLRERRRRQLASGVSISIWVICGGVVALLFLYSGGQAVIIGNYNRGIAQKQTELRGIEGLEEALTAQQHLSSLPSLYDKRVYITRFFSAYSESNPNEITLSSMTVDNQNVMVVNGLGVSYAAVAKLARALEASNVKVGSGASEENEPYFSGVTITSVSSSSDRGVSFTLTATLGSGVTSDGAN
jgi:hypothetical protein